MNSAAILIQPDIVTLSPYRKFRSLCIDGAITYNQSWETKPAANEVLLEPPMP